MMLGKDWIAELRAKDELRSVCDDKNELHRKLHDKVQKTIGLESKLVPLRKQVAELVEARKANEAQVSKLEKKSTEREVLLGKVKQDRDKAIKELGETAADPAGNSNVEESLRSTLCPVYATVFSAKSHRRRL